jgi:hypothetical protein
MQEITEEQKRSMILDLISDYEIVMLYDDMNNCFRPMWANEWNVQLENASVIEENDLIEKHRPFFPDQTWVNAIIENGILEWENDGSNWYVKIWW